MPGTYFSWDIQDSWHGEVLEMLEMFLFFSPVITKGAQGDQSSHIVDNHIMNLTLLYFTSASAGRHSQWDTIPAYCRQACFCSNQNSLTCYVDILGQYCKFTGNTNFCSPSSSESKTSFYWTSSGFLISILGFCFSSTAHHKSDQIVGFLFKTFPSENKIWSLIIQ